MDLYADLPLAKGAKASSALDADGKPKTSLSSTSSVWASTPLMVPQAAKNKSNDRPITNTSMLPSALAAGRGKSPTRSSISLAFKPASVARRTTTTITQVFKKKNEQEKEKVRPTGGGLGYVAATEVKVTSVQQQQEEKKEDVDVAVDAVDAVGGHFFQATYRDEYHPARPNSYEAYCKEQEDRKKMEQVKKELSRRQREQEREVSWMKRGKLEREQLVKDLAEGRAPTMQLPVPAGRGRGMTMPAWMRKKMFVIILLTVNMVGPGEVDDELQDEVKGECSGKYGPVTKCIIYEVTGRVSPEEAVRIFVQFKNAGDATQALTGLNGRFFGGRKVKAVYYDEGKFDGMDLTSQ
ncbi:hypothetical protein PHMEG_00010615 [Phytophthora megakarya]|uniref:RRM domain-containing protein n=1 Tax=Phytophthora megakarya TaxID=4795 RepID=A0A225WDL8_9STRA|nr:hypothetical protein PHMEG_00010615 [Phytophthora megakarya]